MKFPTLDISGLFFLTIVMFLPAFLQSQELRNVDLKQSENTLIVHNDHKAVGEINHANMSDEIAGSFIDERDGQEYKWVMIGDQIWMGENLNYGVYISKYESPSENESAEKYCYKNNLENCTKYGGLYQWFELMDYSVVEGDRGLCPQGWHVPSSKDWEDLLNTIGRSNSAEKLKSVSGWSKKQPGSNEYGFNALAGGMVHSRTLNHFEDLGKHAYFWSSSNFEITTSWSWIIYGDKNEIVRINEGNKNSFSARCVKDW